MYNLPKQESLLIFIEQLSPPSLQLMLLETQKGERGSLNGSVYTWAKSWECMNDFVTSRGPLCMAFLQVQTGFLKSGAHPSIHTEIGACPHTLPHVPLLVRGLEGWVQHHPYHFGNGVLGEGGPVRGRGEPPLGRRLC